jgi:hypothetical protein
VKKSGKMERFIDIPLIDNKCEKPIQGGNPFDP